MATTAGISRRISAAAVLENASLHQTLALQTRQGFLQPLLLLPGIKCVPVTGAGDHAQDP